MRCNASLCDMDIPSLQEELEECKHECAATSTVHFNTSEVEPPATAVPPQPSMETASCCTFCDRTLSIEAADGSLHRPGGFSSLLVAAFRHFSRSIDLI